MSASQKKSAVMNSLCKDECTHPLSFNHTPISPLPTVLSAGISTVSAPTQSTLSSIPAHHPFVITLLQAPPHLPQRKVITTNKVYSCIPPHVWSVHLIYVPTTADFYRWLTYLETQPQLIMIRGCPINYHTPILRTIEELQQSVEKQRKSWGEIQNIYQKLSLYKKQYKQQQQQKSPKSLSSLKVTSKHIHTPSTIISPPTANVTSNLINAEQTLTSPTELDTLTYHIQSCLDQLEILGWVPRRKTHFKEVARQWVWLDLDEGLQLPQAFDLHDVQAHQKALQWVVQQALPQVFHQVSFIAQWSSSAFLNGLYVKAHFAFLIHHPLQEQAWKNWHGRKNQTNWPHTWDPAVFRTVQPHFTAAPYIKSDPKHTPAPYQLSRRIFWVQNPLDQVPIPALSAYKLMAGTVQTKKTSHQTKSKLQSKSKQQSKTKSKLQTKNADTQITCNQKQTPKSQQNQVPPPNSQVHKNNHSFSSIHSTSPNTTSSVLTSTTNSHASTKDHPSPPHLVFYSLHEVLKEIDHPHVRRIIIQQYERLIQAQKGERNRILYTAACVLGRYMHLQISSRLLIGLLFHASRTCKLLQSVGSNECLRQIHNGFAWGINHPIRMSPTPQAFRIHHDQGTQKLGEKLYETSWHALAHPHTMPVLAVTCGAGKTRALCIQMAHEIQQARTRVVLCRTHEMAHDFYLDLLDYADKKGLSIHGKINRLQGIQHHCTIYQNASPKQRQTLHQVLQLGRKALCGQKSKNHACPHLHQCKGAQKPQIVEGKLNIATHAMGQYLTYPKHTLVFIDELPTPIQNYKIGMKELKKVVHTHDHQLNLPFMNSWQLWLQKNEVYYHLVQALQKIFTDFAQAPQWGKQRYSQKIQAQQAIAMLSPLNPLWHTLQTHVTTPFPKPNPRTVRAGKKIHMIQWEWIKLLQDLAHSIPTGQWPQHISWHWHHQKVWFEYRQSYRLPPVACVALDATADRTQQIWHHLAQSNQKEARIVPIAAVGESPLFAKWYATQQLRTSRLISRQTHGVVWKERAIASIRRAAFTVAQTAQQAHLHAEHSIGILASKHVADLFRLACYQKAHPQFDPCDPCVLQMIHAIRSALDAWRLVIGHVGAHDIGSNLYCSVHLLAMLGSSKPDWGATCTDLEALGVATEDCHDLYTDIVAARDIQALARARHVRRKNVALLYIGDMSPPSGYELPDVQWTQIQAVHPQANQERLQLETKAEALLFKQGYVSVPQLQEEFGITRSISQNLCKKLQKTYDLYKWSIHNQRRGRPRVAWGFLAHAPHDPYQTQLALKSISTTCDRSEHDE